MKLQCIRLSNFQSFGQVPTELSFEDATFLIGPNGSGKTAAMQALCRLFAFDPALRRIKRADFHVPRDEVEPPDERTLWIEALGPSLPKEIWLPDTLLVGAGAIRNGIALLLSQLPFRGRVHIVDKQDYADESLGTCVLLEHTGWIDSPKAIRLATWLRENSSLEVTGEKTVIELARSGQAISRLSIDLVLNALDDIDARRDAQSLWPSVIVDGGINEVGAAVVQHRLDHEDVACLKCWFEALQYDERSLQHRVTGLPLNSLADTGRMLSEEDIAQALPQKRDWLRERAKEGKTVCSVISEAVLAAGLGVEAQDGFRPSAPFVATAAATMAVAEAVKAVVFPEAPMVSKFQIVSLFLGPEESALRLERRPSRACQCVVHRKQIDQIRARRAKTIARITNNDECRHATQ